MKAKLSWRRTIFGLITLTLVLLLVFLVSVNMHFYKQASQAVYQSNTQALGNRARELGIRLSAMGEHVREMLWATHEKTELRTGTQMMKFEARNSLHTSMENKLAANQDLDYMYILDTDENMLLLTASSTRRTAEIVAVTRHLKGGDLMPTNLRDDSWNIIETDNASFFAKSYRLGKYVIGCLSNISDFDQMLIGEITGENTGYLLVQDGAVLYAGGYDWSRGAQLDQEVLRGGNSMVSYDLELAAIKVYLFTQENALQSIWTANTLTVSIISLFFVLLLAALLFTMTRLVSHPTQQLLLATQRIEAGDLHYRIAEEPRSREFLLLHNSFNSMAEQIVHLKIAEYEQQIHEKESELKMLRAQIRPHFFLNAVNTVMSMTYQERNDDIRAYLAALSGFMRYMLHLNEKTVRVEDELVNIKHYIKMQEIRFPHSVTSFVGCDARAAGAQVPYLLLFTAVENTFKHAMNLYGTLTLLIQCAAYETESFHGVRIIIEDNGDGFPEAVLAQYAPGGEVSAKQAGHIGLSNIWRTLQLTYHRDDLLRIANVAPHGARVEILIPNKEAGCRENAGSG